MIWEQWWWRAFFVFLLAFAWFLVFQWHSGVADPDAFYHIKLSQLLWQQGTVPDFPWLSQLSILAYSYADQHVLYHAMLAPFVVWGDAIIGAKISVAVFSALAVLVMYETLRSQRVAYAGLWVTLIATTAPWVFRASLIKAPIVSLALLVLGIALMARKKYVLLGVVSFLYVWAYGGFIVLLGVAFLWFAISWVNLPRVVRWKDVVAVWWENGGKAALKSVEAVALGMGAGFVLHPYAPNHVGFLWTQLVDIGILNAQGSISVGGEWYPYGLTDLLTQNILVAVAWFVGVLAFGLTLRAQSRMSWLMLFVSIAWIVMTLKSRRYIEYAVPFAVMSAALATRDAWAAHREEFLELWRSFQRKNGIETRIIKGLVGMMFVLYVVVTGVSNWENLSSGYPYAKYEKAMTWASENIPPGEVFFHDDWDVFPVLFYYDHAHYYLTGLDPTFSYMYDEARYREWVAITIGSDTQHLAPRIVEDFGARYAVVDEDHPKVAAGLLRSGAQILFQADGVTIYQLAP